MKESLKKSVRERAKFCCEYCLAQTQFSADTFSIEHICPRIKGGITDLQNLALSCQYCNNRKFTAIEAFDSLTGSIVSLYNPRVNVWSEHFKWDDDCIEIIGISAIGRATINKLNLNREGLINLRRLLVQTGLHPPY